MGSQLTFSEVSGGLGDLGTFIPLFSALGKQHKIFVCPALFFAGLSNIVTGLAWDLPMPVQPMKAISAIALIDGLSRGQVTCAGIWMGVFLFVLGWSNAIDVVNRIIPNSVVAGMQVGVGMSLAIHAVEMVAGLGWLDRPDCIVVALLCTVLSFSLLRETYESAGDTVGDRTPSTDMRRCGLFLSRLPLGLVLFVIGVVIAVFQPPNRTDDDSYYSKESTIATWALSNVTIQDWETGLFEGALPQLPLSTLNSVISVCCLAHTLYPERRRGHSDTDGVLSRKEVCLSVGLMNLLLCPFGAMPNCHGAGGLAGQHKLGT